jgi:hypothetical protein
MPILTAPQKTKDLSTGIYTGHYTSAFGEVNTDTGEVSYTLLLTCTNKAFGFTAGVQMLYYDANNKLLGQGPVHQVGIGQAPLFSAAHKNVTFPLVPGAEKAPAGTVSFCLAQFSDPKNRFGELGKVTEAIVAGLEDIGGALAGAENWTANWCAQSQLQSDVCAAALMVLVIGVGLLTGGTVVIAIVGEFAVP